jgi:hypothetical protein
MTRLIIDLERSDDGRVRGDVSQGDSSQPFDGWLELLRVLESVLPAETPSAD